MLGVPVGNVLSAVITLRIEVLMNAKKTNTSDKTSEQNRNKQAERFRSAKLSFADRFANAKANGADKLLEARRGIERKEIP